MENKITEDLAPSREVWFCLKGWWHWTLLLSNSESWTAPEVILRNPPTEQGGWACGGVERRCCHHGEQDAMPGVDRIVTQHRFFSHWTLAYVLSPAPRQNKFQVSHWGGAGKGEIPFSEEDLSSLRNTHRGTSVTTCGPAVHYGCPASNSVYLTLRRNHSHLSNPFSSSPIPVSLSRLWCNDYTSQEFAFYAPFICPLPFGYDSDLTNCFSTKSTGPEMTLCVSMATILSPDSHCYASEGGFSCFQFLSTCPNIHQIIPFLIIYYLILKYANTTLKDFVFIASMQSLSSSL